MTDAEIMSLEKAMFILRHGSAEGEHKYFEAINVIEKEHNRQKAEIEKWKAECGNQSTLWSQHYESIFETAKETIKSEAIKEFAEKVYDEITEAIINNSDVIENRVKKHNANRYEDAICIMCDGKIMALGGIKYFMKNLVKEMVGETE